MCFFGRMSTTRSVVSVKGGHANARMKHVEDFSEWKRRITPGHTYPFLHSLLFSSWSLIIATTISSLTRPPASMTFFASTPSFVLRATWSRSMSPVARWHTQNSSRMRGACVPLPASHLVSIVQRRERELRQGRTCTRGADEDRAQVLRWRLGRGSGFCLSLERRDLLVQL